MGCVIFLVLGLGSVAAFGPAVDANILNNLSATGMAPLIGSRAAAVSERSGQAELSVAQRYLPAPAASCIHGWPLLFVVAVVSSDSYQSCFITIFFICFLPVFPGC